MHNPSKRELHLNRLAAIWRERAHYVLCDLTLEEDYHTYLDAYTSTNEFFKKPDYHAYQQSLKRFLDKELRRLRPREELFIRLNFGLNKDPMNYNEIAVVAGISNTRVSHIIGRGIRHLVKNIKSQKEFLLNY